MGTTGVLNSKFNLNALILLPKSARNEAFSGDGKLNFETRMITPDWTIIASAVVFLFTLWALNRILFQPLFRIMDERDSRTVIMKNNAVRSEEQEAILFQEYAEKIKAERQRGYGLVEEVRKEAIQNRQALLDEARRKSVTALAEAKEQIEEEARSAKTTLRANAEEMARIITARVLDKT